MDTSSEYVKMCEKAEEIQKIKMAVGLVVGDYICSNSNKIIPSHEVVVVQGNPDYRYGLLECIWLPRQDQLQEMVSGDWLDKLQSIFVAIRDFKLTRYHYCEQEFPFTSMEQLWLAFVMKELYNKIWNGEEWISGNHS